MPHVSMRLGKLVAERSKSELICLFIVFPVLIGGVILLFAVHNAVANAGTFTLGDWLRQFVFAGMVGAGFTFALPAVAIAEFRRRAREREEASRSRRSP